MNFQTTKARAKWLGRGVWLVSHVGTERTVVCNRPHDSARYLIENYSLRNQLLPRER